MNQKGIAFTALIMWGLVVIVGGLTILQGGINLAKLINNKNKESVLSATSQPTPNPTSTPVPTQEPVVNQQINNTQQVPPTKTEELPLFLNRDHILVLINQYRASQGLYPYTASEGLCHLADQRADYLIANDEAAVKTSQVGNHTGFGQMIENYSGSGVGEDIYANAIVDGQVLEGWEKSPPHNALLLATNYQGTTMTKGCVSVRLINTPQYKGTVAVLLVSDR